MMTSPAPPMLDAQGAAPPLTVLFSFLSRADATPLALRTRAQGHVSGRNGAPVQDPAVDASDNLLEPDPNLHFEHWGEYWRKVHGVRFLHPDQDADQASLDRLLRYDQIHRVAPGPTSLSPLPYRPPLDPNGHLFDTIAGHVEPYKRPSWDGIAYLTFSSLDDLGIVFGSDRVRRKIMPEDQAIFRDLAPILARQFVIIPSLAADDAVVMIKTHVRRPGQTRADFQRRWLHAQTQLVHEQHEIFHSVKRYVQLHNVGPLAEGTPFYHPYASHVDGVTMMAFSSMRRMETFLASPDHAALEAAEGALMTAGAGESWSGIVFNVVDRGADARVTGAP